MIQKNRFFMRFFRCAGLFLFAFFSCAFSPDSQAQGIETKARQAILLDYDTGAVLFEKDADARMPTSSMSKVMTMYLVFEALRDGRVKLDDSFLVSEKAWRMGGSKMFVPVGKKVGLEDLIRGVVIQSGNDATIVLAEGLAGSETAFAQALNKKAGELGMTGSHFMNASGWPDPDHYSTARDLAVLAGRLIADFPEEYKYFSEKEFVFNDIKQGNRNPLLYRDIGADGIKTGHTEDGGYGLMASGVSGEGRRVLMVVNGLGSQQERADESARLLQWGLEGFENIGLLKKGAVAAEAPVAYAREKSVGLTVAADLTVTVPKLFRDETKMEVRYRSPLIAPLRKGEQAGVLVVAVPQGGALIEIPLLVAQDVPELGFFAKTLAKAGYFFAAQERKSP